MHYPHAQELAYLRALLPIAEACQRVAEQVFAPQLGHYGAPARPHQDAIAAGLSLAGRTATALVLRTYNARLMRDLLKAKANEVDDYQRKQLTKRLAAATSVQNMTGGMLTKAATAKLVQGFVTENVALIQSLPEKVFAQVERKVIRAVSEGARVETLRKDLEGTYDIARAKAALIARDQTGKLYGQLNETRQRAVGLTTYIWRTVADERVRHVHQELEGTVQSWDDPPVTNEEGDTNHPGEDYQCRCTAEPNLDELDLDAEQ